MKFRKSSLRSVHTSSTKQLNDDEIRLINGEDSVYTNNINNINSNNSNAQKQNSILNRLLLLQPVHKLSSTNTTNTPITQKKLSLTSTTSPNFSSNFPSNLPSNFTPNFPFSSKYNQTFLKPDIQTLIQQNNKLKTLVQSNNQTINILKIKNKQFEKKYKYLEKGIEKYQGCKDNNKKQSNQNHGINNINNNINVNVNENQSMNSIDYANHNKNKNNKNFTRSNSIHHHQNSSTGTSTSSTGIVHTEILKKKISDLTNLYLKAQNQLKALRRLPNATIFQQNDIQKQHLIAQTVRLKAIVASLSNEIRDQNGILINSNNNSNNQQQLNNANNNTSPVPLSSEQKFQSHFMRLMKQQNEKLKSTIRLLQNDKILLKSRQTIMNKYNNDLKKQVMTLKQKINYKEAQVQKLNNQNKNLLFKKTTQYKQQQQKKQSQIISQLRSKHTILQSQYKKIQQLNDFYSQQNVNLKQKQKIF